jgi:hypothetical protein
MASSWDLRKEKNGGGKQSPVLVLCQKQRSAQLDIRYVNASAKKGRVRRKVRKENKKEGLLEGLETWGSFY